MDQSLVTDQTVVYHLDGVRSITKRKFADLKDLPPYLEDEDAPTDYKDKSRYLLLCRTERIVDMREKQDFVPFVAMKVLLSDYEKYKHTSEHKPLEVCGNCSPRQVSFNVLSVLSMAITCSVPCSVRESSLLDLRAGDVKLSKSTSLQENNNGRPRIGAPAGTVDVDRQQQCRYLVGFYFGGRSQRFLFKEIQVNSTV